MPISRQDFEHQKEINLEAYTLGLMNRQDINFRLDYRRGILEDVSELPLSGNTINDAFYVRDGVNNWIWIWSGAAWLVDHAGTGSGGINYTTAPVTVGNRIVQSIGTNADLVEETAVSVDPITGAWTFPVDVTFDNNTITYVNTTTTGTQNFDAGYTATYTGSTLNFDGTTTNYTNGAILNFDSTTTVNLGGTVNITGTVIGANTGWTEDFVGDGVTTIFTLTHTPVSSSFVFVSGNGKFSQDGGALDYTISGNQIIFNTAPAAGYKIQVKYIESLGTPIVNFVPQKKLSATWTAGGGSSSVVIIDADSVATSVIGGRTVTSGTQIGIWEFDMSTPGQFTITSSATETGTIVFTYLLAI